MDLYARFPCCHKTVRTAMTAHPPGLAGSAASGIGWHWLTSAVEMAALACGNWPLAPDPAPQRWTRFPRIATRTPGADARSVRAARYFTTATLQRWGVAERRDDIVTVVSELLTTAVRHALPGPVDSRPRWPIRLGLLQPGPCVMCAVADPSDRAPVPAGPCQLAETGRGLHVIDALSDQWGYTTPSDTGKVVWATFTTGPVRPPRALIPGPAGEGSTRPGPGRDHVSSSQLQDSMEAR
jgi:anti-sigma regulatory factor (Ser/Thr protein kinase)